MRSPHLRPVLAIASLAGLFLLLLSGGNRSDANPDSTPRQQDTAEIAKEILEIQEAMGGSVVDIPSAELGSPSLNSETSALADLSAESTQKPVTALREASLQLDLIAHRLELLDLYSQSDATRDLAKRLRQDARDLKSHHVPQN